MVKFKEDKKKIIIVAIVGSLFIIVQFVLIDYFENQKLLEHSQVFEKGYNLGLEVAIITIFNNTQDCNVATIFVENSSKQIIDFSCYLNGKLDFLP